MLLARAEPDGLRCIYHGWKFAVDGKVLETPNVADGRFKDRIRGRTFPVREVGGMVWAYLGPLDKLPTFPHWPWMDQPESNRIVTRHMEECNFVQVIEGLVDSSHLGLLHINGLRASGNADLDYAKKVNSMQFNLAPSHDGEDTEFGFYYAALREGANPQTDPAEVRIAAFIAPCIVLNPNGDIASYIVPMGDTRTAFFHIFWSDTEKINEEPLRSKQLEFVGLSANKLDAFGLTADTLGRRDRPHPANNFLQDRKAMREGSSWSGLPGLIEEDVTVSVAAGPIRDRSEEVLSAADVGIARLYRALLSCATAVEAGKQPLASRSDIDWSTVIGTHGKLDKAKWKTLLPPLGSLAPHADLTSGELSHA